MAGGEGELSSYTELAEVVALLPTLLREGRRARRLSVRAAAAQLDMSFATVSRIEGGHDCALSNAMAVLRWLDASPATPSAPEVTDGR
jgi:hypothetical protein